MVISTDPDSDTIDTTTEDVHTQNGDTIIRPKKKKTTDVSIPEQIVDYKTLYTNATDAIVTKDATIAELSYRLGKSETDLKNSISLIEYKKATFLLESSNTIRDEDKTQLTHTISTLESEVSKRNSMILALVIMFITVIISATLYVGYMNGGM
jgi:hypothetical protein